MTVIEFGRKDMRINALYIILGALVVGCVFFSIVSYSRLATLRRDSNSLKKSISQEQVRNAELKASLLQMTDELDAETYLSSRGYVFEKKPVYEQGTVLSQN